MASELMASETETVSGSSEPVHTPKRHSRPLTGLHTVTEPVIVIKQGHTGKAKRRWRGYVGSGIRRQ